MAGGKLSARQKMINLMYLVFIAMLAMKMDKEVLAALGFMNDKVTQSIEKNTALNTAAYTEMNAKVGEQPLKFTPLKAKTDQVKKLSDELYAFVDQLKAELLLNEKDKTDYESMDKTETLDAMFFEGGKRTALGNEFIEKMNTYREGVVASLGETDEVSLMAKTNFSTNDVEREGEPTKGWLEHYYEGYPMVASLTNFTRIQSDIKDIEANALSNLLKGELIKSVSMTNYDAMVVFEKNAYYAGERLSGKIVLGKNDPTLTAESVILNGREMPKDKIQAGQVILDGPAGSVGDHDLKGEFKFKEGDSIISIPIKGSYAVIPKPNEAVISADKMNVVYRGLSNPMTISIPGIPSNKVNATASGLRKKTGSSYIMTPGTGTEVSIRVSGKLPDGTPVSSTKKFRIKDIPKPFGSIRNQTGKISMPKSSLAKASVGVALDGFVFDLKFNVTGFTVKVPGQASIKVNGARMNGQAQNAINRAKRGDVISVFDIKSKLSAGSGPKIKTAAPIAIEIK